jgi:hypothetical protein
VVNNSEWKEKEITMAYSSKMPSKKATKKKVEPKKKKKKPMNEVGKTKGRAIGLVLPFFFFR